MSKKPNIEEYNREVEKYKTLFPNKLKPCSYNKLTQYGLKNARWFILNSNDENIKSYKDFYHSIGYKKIDEMTKEEIIYIIYDMQKEIKRPLMYDDFRENNGEKVGINTVRKYWGTMNKMKEELGLKVIQEDMISKSKSNEELLNDLKNLIEKLKRVPTTRELTKYGINNQSCYIKAFGTYNNALRLLGYDPVKEDRFRNVSNEEIIELFRNFIDSNDGFIPSSGYIEEVDFLPNSTTVCRRFNCTWKEFIKMLGYEPLDTKNKIEYANDGTLCLSHSEVLIHNYLITLPINNLRKEVLYKDILTSKKLKDNVGYKRLDWTFEYNNETYYVEFFGMIGYRDYNKRCNDKINIMHEDSKDNYFIKIFPKDIVNLDKIFSKFN